MATRDSQSEAVRRTIAAIDKALLHVSDLCAGKARWTMRVPVNEAEDSDCVIADALMGAKDVLLSATPASAGSELLGIEQDVFIVTVDGVKMEVVDAARARSLESSFRQWKQIAGRSASSERAVAEKCAEHAALLVPRHRAEHMHKAMLAYAATLPATPRPDVVLVADNPNNRALASAINAPQPASAPISEAEISAAIKATCGKYRMLDSYTYEDLHAVVEVVVSRRAAQSESAAQGTAKEVAELRDSLDRRDESLITRILNLRAKSDRQEKELAALRTDAGSATVPEGMVLVPREALERWANDEYAITASRWTKFRTDIRAMLAACTSQEQPK